MLDRLANYIGSLLSLISAARRDRRDIRVDRIDRVAEALGGLTELFADLLAATDADGKVLFFSLNELEQRRLRVWNRWIDILSSDTYDALDPAYQQEIERCIHIAHAAPGDYVEEILLAQMCLSERFVDAETRRRFSASLDSLRNMSAKLRLTR